MLRSAGAHQGEAASVDNRRYPQGRRFRLGAALREYQPSRGGSTPRATGRWRACPPRRPQRALSRAWTGMWPVAGWRTMTTT